VSCEAKCLYGNSGAKICGGVRVFSVGPVSRGMRGVSEKECPPRRLCSVDLMTTSRTVRRRGVVYSLFWYAARGGSCGVSVFRGDKEREGGKTDVGILVSGRPVPLTSMACYQNVLGVFCLPCPRVRRGGATPDPAPACTAVLCIEVLTC
ncbi:unnamed protein product, partial [Ectocarpus sp. 13 AM-2016]